MILLGVTGIHTWVVLWAWISGLYLVSHLGLVSPAGLRKVQISTPLQVNSTPSALVGSNLENKNNHNFVKKIKKVTHSAENVTWLYAQIQCWSPTGVALCLPPQMVSLSGGDEQGDVCSGSQLGWDDPEPTKTWTISVLFNILAIGSACRWIWKLWSSWCPWWGHEPCCCPWLLVWELEGAPFLPMLFDTGGLFCTRSKELLSLLLKLKTWRVWW